MVRAPLLSVPFERRHPTIEGAAPRGARHTRGLHRLRIELDEVHDRVWQFDLDGKAQRFGLVRGQCVVVGSVSTRQLGGQRLGGRCVHARPQQLDGAALDRCQRLLADVGQYLA